MLFPGAIGLLNRRLLPRDFPLTPEPPVVPWLLASRKLPLVAVPSIAHLSHDRRR